MNEDQMKKENNEVVSNGHDKETPRGENASSSSDSGTQVVRSPLKKNVFTKSKGRRQKPKSEFQQKIINISRVTRVVKGGRRLSFRVDMVIGDRQGRVGLGSGKSLDTSLAIEKAYNQAKKNLMKVGMTDTRSIPYSVSAKFASARVELMPNAGRGLVAGSTVRNVLEYAGMTNITAKVRSRSSNKLNNAKATLKALEEFEIGMSKDADKGTKDDNTEEK